ncbi:serine/threonine receptor-like kinase NFP isoform X1 [Magnolia sinica]|uniref:serine/threonine receptor-like kinase NFP isoform X1 n=1 Tax=Magnolia sinica TaxID=86752 RepID=UPI00265B1836|nr:serine/threonine receptor-like kinase NFP isoform X1 [Magnolia sinica]
MQVNAWHLLEGGQNKENHFDRSPENDPQTLIFIFLKKVLLYVESSTLTTHISVFINLYLTISSFNKNSALETEKKQPPTMAISLPSFEALSFMLLFFHTSCTTAQTTPTNVTDFSCPSESIGSCDTYVVYRAQLPEFLDLGHVSDLFGVSQLSITRASNLVSEEVKLIPDQLLLVPISCGCTGNQSFANITYQIKSGDSFYLVSIHAFENLTDYHVVEAVNPTLNPNELQVGDEVVFPIYCKCPTKTQLEKGLKFLITYVWQAGDEVLELSDKLKALVADVEAENNYRNFSAAVYLPVLVPVSELPILSQPPYIAPVVQKKHESTSHRDLVIIICAVGALSILWSLLGFIYWKCCRTKAVDLKESQLVDLKESRLETINLIQLKKGSKDEVSSPRTGQDKLLSGVSVYLGKLTIYETKTIMEATMNLNERYRIGGSVYRASIKGEFFAVKQAKENFREELKILQKVNHANLVKLTGVSTETDGTCFLVYEFAENGSLDKWLYPKSLPSSSSSSSSFLSWRQRLNIALDVANGLQYMHEHTRPSVVHRDIRTSNILLNSRFKAKIANFSMARPSADAMMLKVDVYSFGIFLLELLSGRKAMETREDGEIVMSWREIRVILECGEKKEDRLQKWMDPSLERFYPIDGALSLAATARSCTLDKPSARPSMGEIVFGLSVLTQSITEAFKSSWMSGQEVEESIEIISPIKAR